MSVTWIEDVVPTTLMHAKATKAHACYYTLTLARWLERSGLDRSEWIEAWKDAWRRDPKWRGGRVLIVSSRAVSAFLLLRVPRIAPSLNPFWSWSPRISDESSHCLPACICMDRCSLLLPRFLSRWKNRTVLHIENSTRTYVRRQKAGT